MFTLFENAKEKLLILASTKSHKNKRLKPAIKLEVVDNKGVKLANIRNLIIGTVGEKWEANRADKIMGRDPDEVQDDFKIWMVLPNELDHVVEEINSLTNFDEPPVLPEFIKARLKYYGKGISK